MGTTLIQLKTPVNRSAIDATAPGSGASVILETRSETWLAVRSSAVEWTASKIFARLSMRDISVTAMSVGSIPQQGEQRQYNREAELAPTGTVPSGIWLVIKGAWISAGEG
jgi:hypothetical protein